LGTMGGGGVRAADRAMAAGLRMKIEPLETALKDALRAGNAEKALKLRETLKAAHERINALDPVQPAISGDQFDEFMKRFPDDGTDGGTTMGTMGGQPRPRGLGNRLSDLGGTDAERAALAARLQGEATQAGGQASVVTRDDALARLIDQPRQGRPRKK
jgi:hypothetical protein